MNPISFQVKMLSNHLNNPQAINKSDPVPPFAKGGLGGFFYHLIPIPFHR